MSTNLQAVRLDQFAIFSMGVAKGTVFYIAIIYIYKKSSGGENAKEVMMKEERWFN